jgi:DNA-binding beta-propeller fold protein YncE
MRASNLPIAIRARFLLASLGATLAACRSDDVSSPPAPIRTVVITPARLVLGVGMTRQLSAAVLDESGTPVPDASFTYESSDRSRVSVTGDGLVSYVAAGAAEITVRFEDLHAAVPYDGIRSGHPLGTKATSTRLPGDRYGDAPFGVAVDAEGRILISQTDSGLVVSDFYPVTSFTTRDLDGHPTSIALLGGGAALVTPTGPDATGASIIEVSTDRVLAEIPLGVSAFSALAAPDSQKVYLGTNDGRVLELDPVSSEVTASIDLGVEKSRVNNLAVNPAGTLLYASSFTTGTISEIDLASKSVARLLVVGGEPQGMAVSPDGSKLYVANEAGNGHIDIYNVVANVQEASIPSGATASIGGPFGLALSPDGASLYVGVIGGEGPGLIQVIDAASQTIERTITSCGEVPRRVAFGFSGGLAVIPDETGCVNFVE